MRFFARRKAIAETAHPVEAKAEMPLAFGFAAPWWQQGAASISPRDGFRSNPVVHRSVRMIASSVAAVPLGLFSGRSELTDHPLLERLARPNPGQSGRALMEALAGHLMLSGNAYLHASATGHVPEALFALRPDRVKPLPGADGWPVGYEYGLGEGRRRIGPDPATGRLPVCHIRLANPFDDHLGLAPVEAARAALELHTAASDWNRALLKNAACPSGALVYSAGSGRLTEDQFARLKEELESAFQGARNAGRPMLLEGGLDWRAMSLSPKEMDFLEARNQAARDIALAFGVPPMLLGIPGDATYANYSEANRAFWRQTVLPLVGLIAESLSQFLGPMAGEEGLRLEADLDRIEALSSEREALWRRVEAASFLTRDEKREAVGYAAEALS